MNNIIHRNYWGNLTKLKSKYTVGIDKKPTTLKNTDSTEERIYLSYIMNRIINGLKFT